MKTRGFAILLLAGAGLAAVACKGGDRPASPEPGATAPSTAAVPSAPSAAPAGTVAEEPPPRAATTAPHPATSAPPAVANGPKPAPGATIPKAVSATPSPGAPPSTPPASMPAPVPNTAPAANVADPGGEIAVTPGKAGLTRVGAEKCKACHKLQHASWAASAHATRTPALDCEGCHGPGSEYKAMPVMKDLAKAKAAGLVIPDAAFCGRCHKGKLDAGFLARAHSHRTAG